MGFSVRLAPGVRVRVSSRGVRTSLGPRVARVHVGAGRPGFSTGAGPVGYYTSLGGSRPRTSTGGGALPASRQLAAANRSTAAELKAEEGRRLNDALTAILNVHRADFPAAQRPVAPEPPPIDITAIREEHRKSARATTRLFPRAQRKAALQEAERRTADDVAALQQRYAGQRETWQTQLDAAWNALLQNDADTVLSSLAEAFEDNEAAAAAVGVEDSEVSLVVLIPPLSILPERHPTLTQAGNVSLKKFTKRETADLYRLLVCGHVLVTVKEAFAVGPRLSAARVVAVRRSAPDAYGKVRPEALLAVRIQRTALNGIRWADADAVQVLEDAATEKVVRQKGTTQELTPIDLAAQPELEALIDAVEFEDLLDA